MTWTFTLALLALPARAESEFVRSDEGDVYELDVQSHTYLELYRRALLPGPNGALVVTDTVAPLYEYVALRARGLDLPFQRNGLDVELNAWGRLELAERDGTQRLDGDLGAANVRYGDGTVSAKLGRQHVAGGAARYVRFDGVSAGARLESGVGADAYAGFAVAIPTYRRRGYLLLGAVPDSLVQSDDAYADAEAASSWLGGVRAFYEPRASYGGSLSFHEQRSAGELERRNVGADAHATLGARADVAANAVLDVDSARVADLRAFADYVASDELDLGAEYLHTEPGLFLSRQSVLSVFSTDSFDEVGGRLSFRVVRGAELGASAHLDHYEDGELGSRAELRARLRPVGDEHLLVSVAYARVLAPQNGYHTARIAIRRHLLRTLLANAEAHVYVYDQAILGYSSSSIAAGSLEYLFEEGIGLLWGASLARSPYASLDAQTLVRFSYALSQQGRSAP